ncbi:MAG: CoA transferase [Actinomycetota bacterium]
MTQPLADVRVVELAEGIAGPYCGKLLADFGADVVKVESADGDRTRHRGPFPAEGSDPEQSALFLHLNTNKRSIVGEAGTDPDGDDRVRALLDRADVVITSDPALDADALRRAHPRLVVVSVTSFGLHGPYAGYRGEEIVHYAVGGPMSATGDPEREPVKMGADLGQYQCGTVAAVATLAALGTAARTGAGLTVDLANVDTQIGSIDRRMTYLLYAAYRGENVERTGGYNLSSMPTGCRPALDGHVQVSTLMNWIPRMLQVVDNADMAEIYDAPDFLTDEDVPEVVDAHLLTWTLTRTRQEAMEQAQAEGWPVTAVNRPVDVLGDPHFADRGFFTTVEHPVAGPVRQAGAPIRLADGWTLQGPAPRLGEHRDEIDAELADPGPSADEPAPAVASTAATGADAPLPLEGIRVLDMTVVWAGPYATCLLGDLGADIVRIDNPYIFPSATRGVLPRPPDDLLVDIGGIFGGYPDGEGGDRPWNRIALFNAHARNKRSVTLDLRQDSGREAFLRLVDHCDVLVENNSVELLPKLGLDWDTLHARNDRLIMVRMPSVGLSGPYRDYLGFGVNFEALCGLGALRGYDDADLSENDAVFHMDAASGSAGALATLLALRRRETTGVGELVEVAQTENMLNHIGELLIDADRTGVEHERQGNRHATYAPQGCYRCAGDDAWAVLSITDDDEWDRLVEVLGSPPWAADERFATAEGRREAHDEIDGHLAAWTAGLTPHEVFERCQANGVTAAPVLRELDAFADPHFVARGLFRPNGSPETGEYHHPAHLWRWDGPKLAWGPLPVMGGDNEAVWRDLVGLTAEEYDKLDADGHLSLDYRGPDGASL